MNIDTQEVVARQNPLNLFALNVKNPQEVLGENQEVQWDGSGALEPYNQVKHEFQHVQMPFQTNLRQLDELLLGLISRAQYALGLNDLEHETSPKCRSIPAGHDSLHQEFVHAFEDIKGEMENFAREMETFMRSIVEPSRKTMDVGFIWAKCDLPSTVKTITERLDRISGIDTMKDWEESSQL